MRKGYVVGAVVALGLSLACIISTAVEVARGMCGLGSWRFWGAVAFHVATALAGVFLLGESVQALQFVGSALILVGAYFVVHIKSRVVTGI